MLARPNAQSREGRKASLADVPLVPSEIQFSEWGARGFCLPGIRTPPLALIPQTTCGDRRTKPFRVGT